jgi:GNAT superfamily N-acetyltransferase
VHSELIVRAARADELAEVGRLTLASYLADGMVSPEGSYARELADASRRARYGELLVAVDPGETLLGTVTICLPGSPLGELARAGELEFRMLAVAPSARRCGVGELLVRAVLARATEIGACRVVLSTAVEMLVAHRLYARLGFSRLPHLDWCPMPGVTLLAFGKTTVESLPGPG